MKMISEQITRQGGYAAGDGAEAIRALTQMQRTLKSVQAAMERGDYDGAENLARQAANTGHVLALHIASTRHHVATVITLAECRDDLDWRREHDVAKRGVANAVRRALAESKPDAG